jgi:hypothetical protein
MYVVHVKRVTASDARKNWFRLLDEVAEGEVVCIDRGGRRILIQRESPMVREGDPPPYGDLIQASEADRADEWVWDWEGPESELTLRTAQARHAEARAVD